MLTSCLDPIMFRHMTAINILSDAGMYFFDYGNAFLLECRRAGADVSKKGEVHNELSS